MGLFHPTLRQRRFDRQFRRRVEARAKRYRSMTPAEIEVESALVQAELEKASRRFAERYFGTEDADS